MNLGCQVVGFFNVRTATKFDFEFTTAAASDNDSVTYSWMRFPFNKDLISLLTKYQRLPGVTSAEGHLETLRENKEYEKENKAMKREIAGLREKLYQMEKLINEIPN